MKQLFAAILCLCLLAGCGRTDSTGNTCRAEDEPTVGAEKAEPIGESFRIIQENRTGSCWPRRREIRRRCIPSP